MKYSNNFRLLLALSCALLVAFPANAVETIQATIGKEGVYTPMTFEANRPVVIEQADTPTAIQFEKVGENWSLTLFEFVSYDFEQLKKMESPVTADAVIVGDQRVMLLSYVKTYEACPTELNSYRVFGSDLNFSIRVTCPGTINVTQD